MSIAHPVRNSADWGRVLIGGSALPGTLTEAIVPPRVWEWAVQNGYGQTKVTVYKSTGLLEEVTFTHFLNLKTTGADDWELLTTKFLPTLIMGWPNKYAGKPRSMPVVHPAVQFLGGKRIHLTKLYAPEPPPNEKIPQFYKVSFQEDVPQTKVDTGQAVPAKINGPPVPTTQIEAGLLNLWTTFKAP
jgi:hypothetical protein